jgi:hypothetical protein
LNAIALLSSVVASFSLWLSIRTVNQNKHDMLITLLILCASQRCTIWLQIKKVHILNQGYAVKTAVYLNRSQDMTSRKQ